jgi:hypothetical protein
MITLARSGRQLADRGGGERAAGIRRGIKTSPHHGTSRTPDGSSSKNPTWFVVFVTVTVIGTVVPDLMVVDVDVGRPVSVKGASWLYATTPVTV